MSEPIVPIPSPRPPEPVPNTTGEGAQSALAAMIRKRKMAENIVDEDMPDAPSARLPRPDPG